MSNLNKPELNMQSKSSRALSYEILMLLAGMSAFVTTWTMVTFQWRQSADELFIFAGISGPVTIFMLIFLIKHREYFSSKGLHVTLWCIEAIFILWLFLGSFHILNRNQIERATAFANQGNIDAQFNLGWRYGKGQGVNQDYKESLKWYQKAAEQGDKLAQFNLALRFSKGEGTEQDDSKSTIWLRKAAEQGVVNAQILLGHNYANAVGVEQNYFEALKWWSKAAAQNDPSAYALLAWLSDNGKGVKKDPYTAFYWWEKSADAGNSKAALRIGYMLLNGVGVDKNLDAAKRYLERAADSGEAQAAFLLGQIYYRNDKTSEEDPRAAAVWWLKAAEQGHVEAQYNLGLLYENGKTFKDAKDKADFYEMLRNEIAAAKKNLPEGIEEMYPCSVSPDPV